MAVRRVRHEHQGQVTDTVVPSLDPAWSPVKKLRWLAAVVEYDTGLTVRVRAYSDGELSVNVGSTSVGGGSFATAWATLCGVSLGAREASCRVVGSGAATLRESVRAWAAGEARTPAQVLRAAEGHADGSPPHHGALRAVSAAHEPGPAASAAYGNAATAWSAPAGAIPAAEPPSGVQAAPSAPEGRSNGVRPQSDEATSGS